MFYVSKKTHFNMEILSINCSQSFDKGYYAFMRNAQPTTFAMRMLSFLRVLEVRNITN